MVEGVQNSCVLAKQDTIGTNRLVGYIVLEDGFSKANIQETLKTSLPDYMVPSIWVELDEMPLTANGKIDRKSLPEPDLSELSSREYVAPRNEVEEQLAIIWQDLLGVEKVGIYDDFFELGGHSLLATRLVSMIRKRLKKELEIASVFEYTKMSDLAAYVATLSSGILLPAITVEERPERIPLSFSQERLWFLDELQGTSEYHIPIVIRLEKELNTAILEEALKTIVRRHEVLRTNIVSEEGVGYQKVISADNWLLNKQEVISEEELIDNLQSYINTPFNLSNDYMLRSCLYSLGDSKYVLACVFHHIASDGWSEDILVSEFLELYSSLQSGKEVGLPTLNLQYSDYAIWQRKYLEGEVLDNQLSYWKEKLSDVSTLELPTDYTRPVIQSLKGDSAYLDLNEAQTKVIKILCQKEGVTPFMFFLSAFKVLLSHYSGQDDICVGTPIANRTQSDLEGMIGFFVNTLALRSDLSGNPSFRNLLQEVKRTTLKGYDNQLVPFERVVDSVITTRDMSTTPLFQVMFALQNTSVMSQKEEVGFDLGNVEISEYDFDTISSKFDLTMNVSEDDLAFSLSVEYCTDLFKQSTIDRMLVHYQTLLNNIVRDASQSIGSLSMLPLEEENQLLNVFNDTSFEYRKDKSVIDLFQDQVSRIPDSVALSFEGSVLTYQELEARSNELACYLASKGIAANTHVGILFNRSFDMVISMLGILKLGCAYVPLDPSLPINRISHIIEDSSITHVVYKEASLISIIPDSLAIESLNIDDSKGYEVLEKDIERPLTSVSYVMYTSGTTGVPKGISINDENIITLINNPSSAIAINSSDRVLQWSNYAFDGCTYEIFGSLLNGATLYLISKEVASDASALSEVIAKEELSVIFITTALFNGLSEYDASLLSSLRLLLFGGEKVSVSPVRKMLSSLGPNKILHVYGPTETTTYASCQVISEIPSEAVTIPIGKPLSNTGFYVLNSSKELVPIGAIGELYISGSGVSQGYLNREELTAERFISNPFKEGERIYQTGDLVRWLPEGVIEFVGRKDSQVKIRGYRIELGEIENVLSEVSGIQGSCVIAKEDGVGNKRLVGYVVSEEGLETEAIELALKVSLPDYMIPSLWIPLESLPLTSNGKLDKKALPEVDITGLSSAEYVAPRNEEEEQLAAIWQELLGVEKVGVHDDFFELGGHSLLATRLVSKIRTELNIEIAIRDIFQYPTIANLSLKVLTYSKGTSLPSITIQEKEENIPLSFSQERLWFLDQLQGSSEEYHIPTVIRLEGDLNIEILENALQAIVNRHEILRTVIYEKEGVGYQQVISADAWSLHKVVTSEEEDLEKEITNFINKPFDLSKDYMLRSCIYDLGNNQYVLACVFHHIASDGWSSGILTNEFVELYRALKQQKTVNLPILSLQYSDYAIWQKKYLEGEKLDSQLLYWKEKLTGVSTLNLPTDYIRPSIQSKEGSEVSLLLDQVLVDSVNTLCQEQGVTPFMFMLSTFKVLLSLYSGQDDICVGTSIANRTQSELESMIGFFVNTLALRSDLSGNPSFKEVLERVKETTLEAYDNQLAPFEKVVDKIVTTRDMSTTPLFQIMFDYQNEGDDSSNLNEEVAEIDDFVISGYEHTETTAQFDLTFNVSEVENNISLAISYCSALFNESTIVRMLAHYQELLKSIVNDITLPISNLSILTKHEEDLLLGKDCTAEGLYFNPKIENLENTVPINVFFEEIVAKNEDQIAVIHNDVEWTFKQLNIYANKIAHTLLESGVSPGDCVGIYDERTPLLIAGMLGIMKAGASYTPFDTQNPASRIEVMLSDGTFPYLITTAELFQELSSPNIKVALLLDEGSTEVTSETILIRDKDFIDVQAITNPENVNKMDSWAYVLFTSGSTGTPKGAITHHKGALNHLLAEYKEMELEDNFRFLQSAGIGSDISVWQILGPILKGGACVIIDKFDLLDYDKVLALLVNREVNVIEFVPTYMNGLLLHIQEQEQPVSLTNLHWIMLVGEAIPVAMVNTLRDLYPSIRLLNAYGPCEASDDVVQYEIKEKIPTNRLRVPIGRPIPNMSVAIFNKEGNLCPIGIAGEIGVVGDGVGAGYLGLPERTAQSFIKNPYPELYGDVMYKTGDLGRWLPDGNIEFIGREDHQVKIRGHRVELDEIAIVLRNHEAIENAHALVHKDKDNQAYVIAFMIPKDHELTNNNEAYNEILEELLELCRASLPAYMHPTHYTLVSEFPVNLSDKVDGKKLLKKYLEENEDTLSSGNSVIYVAPRNEIEKQLVTIWQELLKVNEIGIHDDFFKLGGHSLLATRLVSKIRKELEVEVSIRDIFEYTVVSTLADYLAAQSKGVLLPTIIAEERPVQIPLSFSQERLWFLDQFQGSADYLMPFVFRLEGEINPLILEETFKTIVARHEVLRTNILSDEGIGYQEIMSVDNWCLVKEKVSEDQLREALEEYLSTPFDLSNDYKLRVRLYDLGNEKYVLAAVFHHIASDGWSEDILMNEFTELYNTLKLGKETSLPELSLQYADYAIWQRKYIEGEVLEAQLSYWENQLTDISTLELPLDYVRPAVQDTTGDSIVLELDEELTSSLKKLCQEEDTTLFMVLLSAFNVLLARYSNQDDICIGTPVANRTQLELEGMIGFFVNTLALRSDLSGDPSFRELLARVKETTLEGYDNQLAPFEKVVDKVVKTRDRSITPLFQVMFVLQNIPEIIEEKVEEKLVEENEFTMSAYDEVGSKVSKYDLTLHVDEDGTNITLDLGYRTALFDKTTINNMLLQYKELLSSIVKDSTVAISSLSILSEKEELELVEVFNDTTYDYPEDKTIVDLFKKQVEQTPDAVALSFGNEVLTYKELDEQSNQLAHYLESVGVVKDSRVAILFNRSFDMVISMLGILKLGSTYIPLDPSLPSNRLSHILGDSGAFFLVYKEESLLSSLSVSDFIFFLNIEESYSYESSEKKLDRNLDSTAYVMYTSGTTGKPKGIPISDRNILTLVNNPSSTISITSSDKVLQWSNYAFDGSTYEIYGSLLSGASLHLIESSVASNGQALTQVVHEQGLSVIFITTALFNSMAEYEPSLLASLRLLLFGGEMVSVSSTRKMLAELGPNKILHVYGPTETTTYASSYVISEIPESIKTIPIGSPLSNTQFYVLNPNQQLVPVGAIGELCISGMGVSKGYLNKEELTKEKFIANPFKEGEVIYRTGDLARWLPDGNIEFIGRIDTQVKIRGYRIELGEIETVIVSLVNIQECRVLAKEDVSGNKRLVAYVVAEGKFDKEEIQTQLKVSLPDYMVPQLWVALDKIPLTSNGKLDKKSLPEPDSSDLSNKEYVAPTNETEEELVVIWKELLGIEQIGIYDNFFELGGHSLLATRLVSAIRKELLIEIEIADIFEYSTISDLGKYLETQTKGAILPAVEVENRPDNIPLSFSQERLWFLDQFEGTLAYHIPTIICLEGAVEVPILERVLQTIVTRHEVLRTKLISENGVGYQKVINAENWSLTQEEVNEDTIEKSIKTYLAIPFDLSSDYMFRACLFKLKENKYVLACVVHHIASDGVSGGILMNEFMQLYSAFQSGKEAILPELSLQYIDYAIWQRKYLEGEVLGTQLDYWKEKLTGVDTLALPLDYVRPTEQSSAGATTSLLLDQELSAQLKVLCKQEGVTSFMFFLSAFKVLLSRYSGQDDICVGTPIANRTQVELEEMIGFFVNTLALRSDLSGNPSFKEVLDRVKKTTLEGYNNQLAPFEKVVDKVVTNRDTNMTPLFQVMFDYHNEVYSGGEDVEVEGVEISEYENSETTAQFDLMFSISEEGEYTPITIGYCTDLFKEATIVRMLNHYQELLKSILQDIEQPINNLSLLTKEEETQLFDVFNGIEVDYPLEKTVVDLFSEQVQKSPEAIAAVFKGEELTYKQLDERSNQLGHYLVAEGVKPDDLVGICLDRGLDMLIGVMAILKSGAAYVPIKPDFPKERITYLLEDTGCSLLVTNISTKTILTSIPDTVNTIVLDDAILSSGYPITTVDVSIKANDLAYVIYTSGSTGLPKGAMIEHAGLLNHLLIMVDELNMTSDSTVAFTAPFTFDISVWQMLSGLLCGGRIAIYSEDEILNLEGFQSSLSENQISHLQLVPSYVTSLLESGTISQGLSNLSYFLVTGEAATKSLLDKWFTLYPSVPVVNAYGPAEAADDITLHIMDEAPSGNIVPIGKPVANMDVYVVDRHENLCPVGVVGELWTSGIGVGRGYLNREELTQEKFINNPFTTKGDRLYKTGDLGRWLSDGTLEFVGRTDDQVKIRGYRIELGEIENALTSLESISQCCVLAKKDPSGINRLVAYLVVEEEAEKEKIQEGIKESLPEYMIPQLWVVLEELPLTPNGKIDKKSLPEPDLSELSSKEYVAPSNETEEELVAIWQELLGIERIGIHDDFFELGGHSLLATRLVSMIRTRLATEVSIREIFEQTTVEEQASLVEIFKSYLDDNDEIDQENYIETIEI
ncbi:amino acid adenylation domain-containing protein [Tenacibaculum sp. 190524A02b]|uniref:amino acid adenylation domain-containing protein n=1 Tax=Tenacibaculum vairaonense TaxID=3137860 RepID=UPI0032B20D0D